MNYYIKGNAAKAEQIKAAFKSKGYDTTGWRFNDERGIYYTAERKRIKLAYDKFLINLIKTHPDYKELQLTVEPNFKVGDWIVFNDSHNSIYQISEIKDSYYMLIHTHGGSMPLSFSQGELLRPWTIEDAKDGDVLMTASIRNCPFIYRKTDYNNNLAYYYAGVDGNGDFCEGCLKRTLYHFGPVENVVPATKEQRDLLFAKMKEAGYQWDADKKVLRKIKHYDIGNFHAGMPVLVRADNNCRWDYSVFSRITGNEDWPFAVCNGVSFTQCIPFEGNEHLLGTTDMCDKQYINW